MAETSKKKEILSGIFGAASQSLAMNSPIIRNMVGMSDAFRKPSENETRLGNAISSLKDYISRQSRLVQNIAGFTEFAKDLIKTETKNENEEKTKEDTSSTNQKSEKAKETTTIVEYLDRKDNQYISVFNENNILLERIAKTLEEQLSYAKTTLTLTKEANELSKIQSDLDKVNRSDNSVVPIIAPGPPVAYEELLNANKNKNEEEGSSWVSNLLGSGLAAMGGLGLLGGGKKAISSVFGKGAKAMGRMLPKITPGAGGALSKGLKGVLRGAGRFAGPANIGLGMLDLYSTFSDDTLDAREKTIATGETIGGMAGASAGMAAGAALGSVIPGPGTVIGGAIGGGLGYFGGSIAGNSLGEMIGGDGVEDYMMPEYDAAGNPTGNQVPMEPPPETIQEAPTQEGLSDSEFNELMTKKNNLISEAEEMLPIDAEGNMPDLSPEQDKRYNEIMDEISRIDNILNTDKKFKESFKLQLPNAKPLSSLAPELIQPNANSKQSQLAYLNSKITPVVSKETKPPAPIIVQNQTPTNINNGGNVTNIYAINDSLKLPQQMFNLPTALA